MTTVPDQHHGGDDMVVRTEVIAPGSLDAVPFEFRVSLTVRQAATEAAHELKYRTNDAGFQNADKVELNPDQTLAEAGVNDGYVLYLIDTAGGQ
ncbi:MAG: hypothetical protein ACRDPY_03870 [Streptosporangiaceae bacterium]